MNSGGNAFPRPAGTAGPCDNPQYNLASQGMSLRDWFAGQALAGILAGPCARTGVPAHEWLDVPAHAYELADVMIIERAKQTVKTT